MSRRLLPLLLCLLLCLGGCTREEPPDPQGPQEGQFVFTRENFPVLNGSTATIPLGEALAAVMLGESREEASDLIHFSRTTESYRMLMSGRADLLLSAEPADVIWEEKAQVNFQWDMEPFAIDALVFVVNAGNPVDSLTAQQLRDIYSGKITNWSEVGGADLPIRPFQRNAEAGSQTAMEKLVMGDTPLMEPPMDALVSSMEGLVQAVQAYDDSPQAIGYTMYYYANDMKMAEGLKILSVDGVAPQAETIRSETYPFLNRYYAVVSAEKAEDDPARLLYRWLLSEEGQQLVSREGYVPVLPQEETP